MDRISVVVPNYNGMAFVGECLDALLLQDFSGFEIIVVDNASSDGSREWIQERYPQVRLIGNKENEGFPAAVNAGIRAARAPYVVLLNNDAQPEKGFLSALFGAIEGRPELFSVSAKMLQYHARDKIDGAGDLYNALGWAVARGKDTPADGFTKSAEVFSACAGAAIYRKSVFDEIGYFDERHFAYLEDVDIGYRAKINGYHNWYEPSAVVYHIGSASSGSRYNAWKTELTTRNSIYLYYKNMRTWQIALNAPLLFAGWLVKLAFFVRKSYAKAYLRGTREGFKMCKKEWKTEYLERNRGNYWRIQKELWRNIGKRGKTER